MIFHKKEENNLIIYTKLIKILTLLLVRIKLIAVVYFILNGKTNLLQYGDFI